MDNITKKYLYDILRSINSIESYFGEKRLYEDYNRNDMLQKAVERHIEIIGEAANRLAKHAPEIKISNSRRIIAWKTTCPRGHVEMVSGKVSQSLRKIQKKFTKSREGGIFKAVLFWYNADKQTKTTC